ncbi:ankyrin repeat domain-containing protein [bacterium]|nr:ankyrin repeat domain-containing protein [bacterium]
MIRRAGLSLLITALIIVSFSTSTFATPFTEAVQANDEAALDTLLAGEDAAKLMNRTDESDMAPIHYAVELNLRALLSKLVKAGADLEVEDPYGRTPLLLAADRGDAEVTGYLLRNGAASDAEDDAGFTAMHYTAMSTSVATMDTLLSWSANVDATDDLDRGPLTSAVLARQPEMIDKLLLAGANPNLRDKNGMGPLHHAVMIGAGDVVAELVKQFSDIDMLTGTGLADDAWEGATALHLAIAFDNNELMEQLIAAGASTAIANRKGDTPLMLAIRQAPGSTVTRLLALDASQENVDGDETPMSLALERGDVALIGSLVDHGAKLDVPLPSGDLPLLAAVRMNNPELVEVLLERGARADTTAQEEYPLELALVNGNLTIAARLLDSGANPNRVFAPYSTSVFGTAVPRTPLSIAVRANSLPLTRLLLDRGADVNQTVPDWDQTLLEQAVEKADLPLVRLLVAEGAAITPHTDPSEDSVGLALTRGYPYLREVLKADSFDATATDRNGNSYLHLATANVDDPRLIRLLAASGTQVDATNAKGSTPMHDAARRMRGDQVRVLLQLGADATMLDAESRTALDVARGGAKVVLLTR